MFATNYEELLPPACFKVGASRPIKVVLSVSAELLPKCCSPIGVPLVCTCVPVNPPRVLNWELVLLSIIPVMASEGMTVTLTLTSHHTRLSHCLTLAQIMSGQLMLTAVPCGGGGSVRCKRYCGPLKILPFMCGSIFTSEREHFLPCK